jgi:hypothetical protein
MVMVVVMVVAMVPPMVVMMAMVPPMTAVMVMTVGSPIEVVHVCCQLAGVALSDGDARDDRSRRLRLLRGSRDNQKRAESGQS